MFADFRVHGLNTTFFECFHPRSAPTYRKRKRRATPIFFNPCTRKSANMGHPSRGQGLLDSRESDGRKDSKKTALSAVVSHSSPKSGLNGAPSFNYCGGGLFGCSGGRACCSCGVSWG